MTGNGIGKFDPNCPKCHGKGQYGIDGGNGICLCDCSQYPHRVQNGSWNHFNTYIKSTEFMKVLPSGFEIKFQDGPIDSQHPINGEDIDLLGELWLKISAENYRNYPTRENMKALDKIEEALMWKQKAKEMHGN